MCGDKERDVKSSKSRSAVLVATIDGVFAEQQLYLPSLNAVERTTFRSRARKSKLAGRPTDRLSSIHRANNRSCNTGRLPTNLKRVAADSSTRRSLILDVSLAR